MCYELIGLKGCCISAKNVWRKIQLFLVSELEKTKHKKVKFKQTLQD